MTIENKTIKSLRKIHSNRYNTYQQKLIAFQEARIEMQTAKQMTKHAKIILDFALNKEEAN